MSTLIQPFINLLLFRAGPQDMPASISFLRITLFACFAASMLGFLKTLSIGVAIVLSGGQIALLAGFIYILLKSGQKQARWVQTLTAIFGALAITNFASIPFIEGITQLENGELTITSKMMVVAVLHIWFFITMVRVMRDALEITLGRAIWLTLLANIIVPVLLSMIIGAMGLDAQILNAGANNINLGSE